MALTENRWISASAGSGKTKALIDRFLKILLEGTPPTKILCITFTRAAATEMSKRVTEELTEWAICNDETLIAKIVTLTGKPPTPPLLKLARNCFERFIEARGDIHISTIHAFCQSLIEKFPLECKLDPGYKLADDRLAKTLGEEAKISFLNDDSLFKDPPIEYLFTDLNESKLDRLLNKILSIHNLFPNFFKCKEGLATYIEGTRKEELKLPNNYSQEEELKKLMTNIRLKVNGFRAEKTENIAWLGQTVTMSDKDIFSCLQGLFLTKKNLPRVCVLHKNEVAPEAKNLVHDIQTLLLSYLEHDSAYKIYKQTFGVLSLGHLFMKHYDDIKNKRGILDYGDIIQRGVALLKEGAASSWFLHHLNNTLSHIMIDEAQDLSKMQWDLIEILSHEFLCNSDVEDAKSLFVVGDPKQAIYSFQGSSPLMFSEKKKTIESLVNRYHSKIVSSELKESFRSDPVILKFIDKAFRILREKNTEYFVEETGHISNKKFKNSSVELWPLVSTKISRAPLRQNQPIKWKIQKEYEETQNAPKILANKIALRIKDLLNEGYLPSDIMMLVRKRDALMEQLTMTLKSKDIPVSGIDRLILNKNLAIQDLLSLGRFLLSPYDDYNLACLLKSPIFSVTEEELFELCNREKLSLWKNIKRQTNPRYIPIREFLTTLLEDTAIHTPYRIFVHVLDILRFRTAFLAHLGTYLNEILDEFLNICLEFEDQQSTSLSLFVDWFAKTEIEIKRDAYTNPNEVRLMTIHAAKGLQAKIVILPDTTSVPKYKKDGVLLNMATRKLIAYQGAGTHPAHKKIIDGVELQILQEYYRLLYVALTRAAEKLIICGWANSKNLDQNSWYSLLDETLKL